MLPVMSICSFTKYIYILLKRLISIKRQTPFVVKVRLKTHVTRTADNLQLEHFTRRHHQTKLMRANFNVTGQRLMPRKSNK